MSVLPRALTVNEVALQRSNIQCSRLFLTVDYAPTVYTAVLAALPASTDKIASITYNSGSGTHTDVLADHTLLVGSTAGAADLGVARIRNTTGIGATSGTFAIGETSEVRWASGAYLTVLDYHGLHPRHVRISPLDGTTPWMDYDIPYTDQNTKAGAQPTPIMGTHWVKWLMGDTVSIAPDATDSWVKDGTIATFAWVAPGSSSSSGMSTATPTITYNATGRYRIACTVTGDNGKSFTGYRYVFIADETHNVTTQFTLDYCSGDYNSGGWSFKVTLYDQALLSQIRHGALVILHALDYYNGQLSSMGFISGCENIIAVGRVAKEELTLGVNGSYSTASLEIQGPHHWLGRMTAFPSGVKDVSDATTPNKWIKFRGLTLNKALYHFMAWRTTATRCMDVYPNTDDRRHKRLEAPGGQFIWSQLVEVARRSMLADPACDRYGRLFFQINQQVVVDRSGMPTTQAITRNDWTDKPYIAPEPAKSVSLVDLSGISWDGTTAVPIFSLSPGHVFARYGRVEVMDRLMLVDQASSNTMAGLISAWRNNLWPRVDLSFGGNYRMIDIAPYQRLTMAIEASDTPRGRSANLTLIPRNVSHTFNHEKGYLLTSSSFEAEVVADIAVTGDTPVDPPDVPVNPIDPPIDPPPIDPIPSSDAKTQWQFALSGMYYADDFFSGGAGSQPTWHAVAGGYPAHAGTIEYVGNTRDGSTLYVVYSNGYVNSGVFMCSNPRSASPTWTDILAGAGPSAGVARYAGNQRACGIQGNTFWIFCNSTGIWYHRGVYNGSAWSWSNELTGCVATTDGWYGPRSYYRMCRESQIADISSGVSWSVVRSPAAGNGGNVWSHSATSHVTVLSVGYASTVGTVQNADTGASIAVLSDLTNSLSKMDLIINGSQEGNKVFAIQSSGALKGRFWIGDVSSITYKDTWLYAHRIHDSKLTGGGQLVMSVSSCAANNEFIRISRNGTGDAASWESMTGNFWSLTSGDQTFINSGVAFT